MKNIFLYILFTLVLINCKGQTKDEISDSFNTLSEYYFDRDEKIPSKFNIDKSKGSYTIFYLPKDNLKEYYDNFLKSNTIVPIEDEYNDTYLYKKQDNKKISLILKNKLEDISSYFIIGKYIPAKYFEHEGKDNYVLKFPYNIKFYKKTNNGWIFLKDFNVNKYEDDVKFSKKDFLQSLISATNTTKKNNLINKIGKTIGEKWYGKYSLTLNEDSEDWRNIHDIKLLISKDSIVYSAEGFQLYEFYRLSAKENKSNILNLEFSEAIDNTQNTMHLQKTKDFGTFIFDGEKYSWTCPYIDESFTNGKKNIYVLKKEK